MHKRTRLSRRRGFTLVELLVVVAIIALLVSILLPSLGRAKAAAKLVICQTNMHAIGRGAYMYASNNDDFVTCDAAMTDRGESDGYYFFASRFSPYVGGPTVSWEDESLDDRLYEIFENLPVYKCPSFQKPDYVVTYLTNGFDFNYHGTRGDHRRAPDPGCVKTSDLPRAPAEIGFIAEINSGSFNGLRSGPLDSNEAANCGDIFGPYDVTYYSETTFNNIDTDDQTNSSPRMIHAMDERHQGRTTLAFFDGHAESRRLDQDELPFTLFNPAPD